MNGVFEGVADRSVSCSGRNTLLASALKRGGDRVDGRADVDAERAKRSCHRDRDERAGHGVLDGRETALVANEVDDQLLHLYFLYWFKPLLRSSSHCTSEVQLKTRGAEIVRSVMSHGGKKMSVFY